MGASTPQPIAQVAVLGCEQWRPLVQKYEWDVRIAMAVMEAETHCRSDAVGDNWVIGGIYAPSCGLFQIRTLPERPDCETLKNPSTNIEYAYTLYKARGFQPWTMYNNGEYEQYLK